MYPRLPFVFRFYFLWELPGWGHLYRWLKIPGVDNNNEKWRGAPTLVCRGKYHHYKMRLRLADDLDRDTYFLGRYYDLEIQLLLNVLLRPADSFLDIGANVGRATLHAARCVGPNGRVIAIEPQPECCEKIREAARDNNLTHIEVHEFAAGDKEETLDLMVLGGGTIMAALAIDEHVDRPNVREVIQVSVVPADRLTPSDLPGRLAVKIDVEGFELYALRGLQETIRGYRPTILTEFEPRYLARAGVDAEQLFEFFHNNGYSGYLIGLTRNWLRRPTLSLRPVSAPSELGGEIDVVWIAADAGHFDPSPWIQ
jgi:FkbM family methyltransferase